MNVLLIEDDDSSRKSMKRFMESKGFSVTTSKNGKEALGELENGEIQLIVSDKKMPQMSGIEFLKKIREDGIKIPVIILTAFGDIDSAVNAMQLGASHYIQKPVHPDDLLLKMNDIIEREKLTSELQYLRKELDKATCFNEIIGKSAPIRKVFDKIKMVGAAKSTVLIQGESGTGKELVARAIHKCGPRKSKPFVVINCAAMPETLFESELFGHVKGAFTGAVDKKGLFEEANYGTLFIDEIGELKRDVQVKLLRVIENKTITRVGATVEKSIDVRLLAATNRCLENEVKSGNFRSDLFYRLNVVCINAPPLRERKEDIALMIRVFTEQICEENNMAVKTVDPQVVDILTNYSWPGNVRELRNLIESIIVLSSKERIAVDDLPANVRGETPDDETLFFKPGMSLAELEKKAILFTLKRLNENRSKTAEALGVSLRTIQRKINDYELQ